MPVRAGRRVLLMLLMLVLIPAMVTVLGPVSLHAQATQGAQDTQDGGPLSPEAARQFLQEHPGVFLIDLRTDREFSLGHLPGAVNIPARELEPRAQEVPAGRPVLVYCGLGFRSATSQRQLRHLRPDVGPVYYITGRPMF
ncbi:rhodanese-like domain-containing protein [Megalodesulfovibrio gigas]|uniref:rhodanese-like domain-containing protein n=1 Tax=Megalodesulfovibrio gigas TaxID=879 RepID=UPI00040F6C33|nr:rhodanese-like domain-containing protein [Megalodesulfovibrio gigas]